jgi:carbonic anhydrase
MRRYIGSLASLLFIVASSATVALAAPEETVVSPAESLRLLKEGNTRYLTGISKHPRIDPAARLRTATEGQKPIASILGCADARVPVEAVFDKAFGELFVVRVAGNVCEMAELASLEFGVLYLNTPLVVVLGHSQCGAVQAAVSGGESLKGTLPLLMEEIRPAVEATRAAHPDLKDVALVDAAIEENVRHSIAAILKSPGIKAAVDANKVMVVGGVRDLKTGEIHWLK